MRRLIAIISLLTLLTGCEQKVENGQFMGESEAQLVHELNSAMAHKHYRKINELASSMVIQYPQSKHNVQALIDSIYASYREDDISGTQSAADQFLSLYPYSQHGAYALYMKGMILLKEHGSWFQRKVDFPPEKMAIDQLQQAFTIFKTLTLDYPESDYAPYARYLMWRIKVSIAKYELNAAKVYYARAAYVAAINRAMQAIAVDDRADTAHVIAAKELIARSYRALGLSQSQN
jgi:outer membrane protein assembly factor BamD